MTENIYTKEINIMGKKDQKLRTLIFSKDYKPTKKDWKKLEQIDVENTSKLKEIISTIGYPTISKVGEKASINAWIIIQHATHDLPFMKSCLKLMKQHLEDIDKKNYAYLLDRVLMKEGKPQVYGTQVILDKDTSRYTVYKLQNPEKVDELREKIGLVSLESYINSFNS